MESFLLFCSYAYFVFKNPHQFAMKFSVSDLHKKYLQI